MQMRRCADGCGWVWRCADAAAKMAQIQVKQVKLIPIMYQLRVLTSGIERAYQPQRAEWVQVAGIALGAASSILGGLASSRAAKRAEELRQQQDARNDAWFARKYNESYIDTAAGRNAIRQAVDYGKTMTKRAEGAAAVTGGTDAAVAQAKEGANKMIGDTIGNLAAQDTQRKDAAEQTHLAQQAQSTAQQMQTQQTKANAIAQVASGASNALIQGAALMGSGGSGGSKTTDAPSNNTDAVAPSGKTITTSPQEQAQLQTQFELAAQRNIAAQQQAQMREFTERHGLTDDDVLRPRP